MFSAYFLGFLKTTVAVWSSAIVIGFLFEKIFPAEKNQPKAHLWLNLKYAVLYGAVIYFLSPFINGWVQKAVSISPFKPFFLFEFETPTILLQILGGLLTFLVTDFFYYWLHRSQHKIPLLWEQHSFHHSEMSMNASTGIRHHWLEIILQSLFIGLPLQLFFKLPLVSWGAVSFILAFWSFFIHSNIKLNMGILTSVFTGPQLHRLHHSIQEEHFDKNFAAYFPIWDIIFGTYCPPKKAEFPATGLTYLQKRGEKAYTLLDAFFWPIRRFLPAHKGLKLQDASLKPSNEIL